MTETVYHVFGRALSGLSAIVLPILLMGALPSGCRAQAAAGSVQVRYETSEKFIAAKLALWQKRLKLEDWKIAAKLARATDLRPRTLGSVRWDLDKREAVIRVLDPADYEMPFHEMLDDMEFTIVHELIHLKLLPLQATAPRSQARRRDEEQTIDSIADALLGK